MMARRAYSRSVSQWRRIRPGGHEHPGHVLRLEPVVEPGCRLTDSSPAVRGSGDRLYGPSTAVLRAMGKPAGVARQAPSYRVIEFRSALDAWYIALNLPAQSTYRSDSWRGYCSAVGSRCARRSSPPSARVGKRVNAPLCCSSTRMPLEAPGPLVPPDGVVGSSRMRRD